MYLTQVDNKETSGENLAPLDQGAGRFHRPVNMYQAALGVMLSGQILVWLLVMC